LVEYQYYEPSSTENGVNQEQFHMNLPYEEIKVNAILTRTFKMPKSETNVRNFSRTIFVIS
jgi:hypothetical protein